MEAPQIPMENAARKSISKHGAKAWAYPGANDDGTAEYAASCLCGFTRVGLATMAEAENAANNHWKTGFVDPTPKQDEVLITSKGHEVKVKMTDQEAYDILRKEAGARADRGRVNGFMESLCDTWRNRGKWSDGQRSWVHLMANQAVEPKPEPKLSSEEFPRLVEMLHSALEHLKHPRIVVEFDEGSIRLNVATEMARVPGSLNVTSDGAYEDRTWYGRIHKETGKFEASKNCPGWVVSTLVEFNADPVGVASLQGQKYGNCCFCRRELITNESLEVGYGPVCADRYGLPWG